MNFNTIKQELRKKIAGMSIDDFDEFIEQMFDFYNNTHCSSSAYIYHQRRDCRGHRTSRCYEGVD